MAAEPLLFKTGMIQEPRFRIQDSGVLEFSRSYRIFITPSLHHSITPSLHHSITPSLHHSITPSLHHSITPSLPSGPLLGGGFVAGDWLSVVAEFVHGPEQAAGDEVEVAGVFHGGVVVAEGGGEDAGL